MPFSDVKVEYLTGCKWELGETLIKVGETLSLSNQVTSSNSKVKLVTGKALLIVTRQ